MPESKSRKKTAKVSKTAQQPKPVKTGNAPWFLPVLLTLMVLGLLWIVVAYLLRMSGPIPGIGNWNLVVGFAILISGFLMTTRWR